MRIALKIVLAGLVFATVGCGGAEPKDAAREAPVPDSATAPDSRPNILLIVADDLGFTDLGAFGGEISTPHLDQLARDGLRLTNFHAGPSCAPTRAMLLTGTDNHRAGMGSQSGLETENQKGHRQYLNKLLPEVPTVAEHFRTLGYRTVASAKWHLGHEAPHLPGARGFDRSFVLLEGGGGHFDATPLFERYGAAHWLEDDQPYELPENFYSSDYMTDKLMEYLDEGESPFFAYLGYTAPHWPLQAPLEDLARYRGRYDAGWQALHQARMAGAKREGVIAEDAQGVAREPGVERWQDLDEQEQAVAVAKMEAYAAMVDRIDQNIGRLLGYLAEHGQLNNTVIFFMADNGAEAHAMELLDRVRPWVEANFDNSAENIGTGSSYVTLGPSWARATAAPFRDSKSKMAEGGIRVPAFVRLPGGKAGIDGSFMRVMDLAPTFLQLAGGQVPADMMGRSLFDRWSGGDAAYSQNEIIAGETYNRKYVYRGNWKLLYQEAPYGTGTWELYNLAEDVQEQNNLAAAHPELVAELAAAYDRYAADVGVVVPDEPIYY